MCVRARLLTIKLLMAPPREALCRQCLFTAVTVASKSVVASTVASRSEVASKVQCPVRALYRGVPLCGVKQRWTVLLVLRSASLSMLVPRSLCSGKGRLVCTATGGVCSFSLLDVLYSCAFAFFSLCAPHADTDSLSFALSTSII